MRGWIQNGIYHKFEDEKQKLRMSGGSWSINLQDIVAARDKGQFVRVVEYETDKAIYRIDFVTATQRGFRVMLGGEAKLVVPLKHWSVISKETVNAR